MTDDFDREHRKSKKKSNLTKQKSKNDFEFSDEYRFIAKSKKAFKNKKQDMRGDELWEDWEDMRS